MKTFLLALAVGAVFTASVLFAGSTDTNSVAGSFYRTVVSTNTGQYAVVDLQKEVVILYDRADHVVWTTNIVMALKTTPVLGERKIHGLSVYKGDLWANVGRGYGIIDIQTGDFKGFAQR